MKSLTKIILIACNFRNFQSYYHPTLKSLFEQSFYKKNGNAFMNLVPLFVTILIQPKNNLHNIKN